MSNDLIFLAASSVDHNRTFLDKYLNGYATIQFSPSGGVEVGYEEEWFTLTDGAWFWPAHPGERIRFRPAHDHKNWAHRHVGFRGSLIEQWRENGLWLERPQRAPTPRDVAQWDEYFGQLIHLARRGDARGRLRAANLLEGLLLELADARTAQSAVARRAPWLAQVIEEITARPDAQNTPPEYRALANRLGMSEATLRRRFKNAMSISPHAYVLQSRAAAARSLLSETDMPLKEIASRLGYENEYFFSRQFKELVGVAPGNYRKSRLIRS